MITSTVGELLDDVLWDKAAAHHDGLPWGDDRAVVMNALRIYVVRRGETILYVGRSGDPVNRLYGHLGLGSWAEQSYLGRVVNANLPESRDWQIELMSIADCEPHLEKAGYSCDDPLPEIETVERVMIAAHHPCLNCIYNLAPTPLPEDIEARL